MVKVKKDTLHGFEEGSAQTGEFHNDIKAQEGSVLTYL